VGCGRRRTRWRARPSSLQVVGVDRDELLRVLKAFEDEGLEYVLIEATALALHGIVRATEDVDLMMRATTDSVERRKRAFRAVYADDPSIDEIRAHDLLGVYPALTLLPSDR
jgi:hypothetical protein